MGTRCCWVLASVLFCHQVNAHRLDELLQAALIVINRTHVRVECELTPGLQVARRILESMDLNRDGIVSDLESHAYTEAFRSQVIVRLDDSPLHLSATDVHVPALQELTNGSGTIQIELEGRYPPLSPGTHRLQFENHHLTNLSVYLANALLPEDHSIEISRQTRDELQRTNLIELIVNPPAHGPANPPTPSPGRSVIGRFWLAIAAVALVSVAILLSRFRRRQVRS